MKKGELSRILSVLLSRYVNTSRLLIATRCPEDLYIVMKNDALGIDVASWTCTRTIGD